MRYPTRNGLVVPITEIGFDEVPHERRRTTNHHLYFCREWYTDTRYKQVFRGLLSHLVTMPIEQHQELHKIFEPPKIPKDSLMIEVVDEYLFIHGQIDVVREKRTNETYQVTAEQWQNIRNRKGVA